jgi:putative ATP-dependent endonuclease of the OLD family
LDNAVVAQGDPSLTALGVALVDAGGCDHIYKRANAFQRLGYRVCVFRDDDKQPDQAVEEAFTALGDDLFKWRKGHALEDELFLSLSDEGVFKLLSRAEELHGEDLIDDHIRSVSAGKLKLADCRTNLTKEKREMLAQAARKKKNSWFKTVGWMEGVAEEIVTADENTDQEFCDVLNRVFTWIKEA